MICSTVFLAILAHRPPAHVVAQGARVVTGPQAAYVQAIVGGTTQPPCSARTSIRPIDWTDPSTVAAYTDTAPLTTIKIDHCQVIEGPLTFTNPDTTQDLTIVLGPRAVLTQVSFSPTFQAGFEVISTLATLPPVSAVVAPGDTFVTFQNVQTLGIAHLDVLDDSFFRSPFAIYTRTTSAAWTYSSSGGWGFVLTVNTQEGTGTVFNWNVP